VAKKSTVTIHDVAEAAGVSVSTVSRVLNNKDDVAPETYEKVRTVIQELGYASNLAARSMRSRKTNVIGLIMPDVSHAFTIQVMKGVSRAIENLHYDLVIYTSGSTGLDNWMERERYYVSLLSGSITDGIIVVVPTVSDYPTSSPVVAVDPHKEGTSFPAVISTNHAGTVKAMEYLISLGHRRIGFIGGRTDLQSAIRRLQGYKDALQQANIPLEPDLIQPGDFNPEAGFIGVQKLLSLPNPPTAIFAGCDRTAFGVVEATRQAGLRVPENLSVVGFDNIPEASYFNPPLTTVDQSIELMGTIAVEMLVKLIQDIPLESNLHKVSTQLIIRESCRAINK
jgi:LacI family transcriptional regulator